MLPSPPRGRKRILRALFIALFVVVLGGVACGIGDVVRAAFDPPPAVRPYDPLQRW